MIYISLLNSRTNFTILSPLTGDEIPFLAKVLTLCDCFDAIVSKRPYKNETTVEIGIDQIKKGINTQFDKELANKFIKFVKSNRITIDEILKI